MKRLLLLCMIGMSTLSCLASDKAKQKAQKKAAKCTKTVAAVRAAQERERQADHDAKLRLAQCQRNGRSMIASPHVSCSMSGQIANYNRKFYL